MEKFERIFTRDEGQDYFILRMTRIATLSSRLTPDKKTIPLHNDSGFVLYCSYRDKPLFLPKLYAALVYFTGESDTNYDDWKGSFSFYFHLSATKNTTVTEYLYHVFQYRDFVRIEAYQLVPRSDPRPSHVYDTLDNTLLSEKDFKLFLPSILMRVVDDLDASDYKPDDFILASRSDLMLFGYRNNDYFLENYREEEEFKKALGENKGLAGLKKD